MKHINWISGSFDGFIKQLNKAGYYHDDIIVVNINDKDKRYIRFFDEKDETIIMLYHFYMGYGDFQAYVNVWCTDEDNKSINIYDDTGRGLSLSHQEGTMNSLTKVLKNNGVKRVKS